VLVSLALAVLVLALVSTVQLYWSGLHRSVEQMRESVARAQQEQQRLLARVRAAEAARRASPTDAEDDAPQTDMPPDAVAVRQEDQGGSSPTSDGSRAKLPGRIAPVVEAISGATPEQLTPTQQRDLAARLRLLSREAARLPLARQGRGESTPLRSAQSKQLLRDQLGIAQAAVAAGDAALLRAALFAAQRLSAPPYRAAEERTVELHRQLAQVRSALDNTPGGERRAPGLSGVAPAPVRVQR
jgi:hypothetical protein